MGYSAITVIGNGSFLISCLKLVKESTSCQLKCIEPEKKDFSSLESFCRTSKIEYQLLDSRKALHNYFEAIDINTLVLSIHNSYIFSKQAIANKHIRIINFHNSLLPQHPGRNAPTWAIFEMEEKAGITWHEVVPAIDKGDIICQRSIPLNSDMTGMSLTRACVQLGLNSFKEILNSLINDNYVKLPQTYDEHIKMHYSYEVPNDGIFEKSWPVKKMSAFLRSLDYGGFPIFAKPKVFHNQLWHSIDKYVINAFSDEAVALASKETDTLTFQDKELSVQLYIKPLHS